MKFHEISWNFMTFHDISWHFMTFHDISRHFMTFHDISWHFMTFHDILWHFMTFHDISWHFMTFWSCHNISIFFLRMFLSPTSNYLPLQRNCANICSIAYYSRFVICQILNLSLIDKPHFSHFAKYRPHFPIPVYLTECTLPSLFAAHHVKLSI